MPSKPKKTDIFSCHTYAVRPCSVHTPGMRREPHCHPWHEIVVIGHGACQLMLVERTGWLQVNSGFFAPKEVMHSTVADPVQGCEHIVVSFRDLRQDLLVELSNACPGYVFHLSQAEQHNFTYHFYRIQREIITNSPYMTWQCQSLIEQLVILLLRTFSKTNEDNLSLEQQQVMDRALRFLHEHARENLTIRAVADHIGLSPVYFRRLFRTYVGINPKRYLLNLRVQTAQFMLLYEDYSITEVAMRSGFGSPQEFSKLFRCMIGVTPSEWRAT